MTDACPPGASEDGEEGCTLVNDGTKRHDADQLRQRVQLSRCKETFIDACNEEHKTIEEEMKEDGELLASIIGMVVGPLIGIALKVAGKYVAKEIEHGLEGQVGDALKS